MSPQHATLDDARAWLFGRADEGVHCPCCTQFAKVYRRKLTGSIARVLIAMWREAGRDWVYLPDIRSAGQDEAIARYWGLIEPYPDARRYDGSSRVGWWRLTPLGVQFVQNDALIPKYASIYNGNLVSLDAREHISIIDALGTKFNYSDLMGGI